MTHSSTTLSSELRGYRDRFAASRESASVLVSDLSESQVHWQPAPDRWSVAQVIEHLNLTGYAVLPRIQEAIGRARESGRQVEGPFHYGWLGSWFVRMLAPENRKKIRAPRLYRPPAGAPAPDFLPRFLTLQDHWIECVESADGVDMARIKIASPALALLRLSLGLWFAGTANHEERHLLQARGVREDPEFPAG